MNRFAGKARKKPRLETQQLPARRPSRKQRRIHLQRIAVFAVVFLIIIFALATLVRSCQHSRKANSYRTYFNGVTVAIKDSEELGKQLEEIVSNPTRHTRKELTAKLDEFKSKQAEIAVRAERLKAPDALSNERAAFATGMRVRAEGFRLFSAAILPLLSNKKVSADQLTALSGYFSGPDAYYMSTIYVQARTKISKAGITDVPVPVSTFYLEAHTFDRGRLAAMLKSMSNSAKLTGNHGVGLASVTATPSNTALKPGQAVEVPASNDLAFTVSVQNQGDNLEESVNVTATLTLPDKTTSEQKATIGSIAAKQSANATIKGFTIPAEAMGKALLLKIVVDPVPGERVKNNNTATYTIFLRLT